MNMDHEERVKVTRMFVLKAVCAVLFVELTLMVGLMVYAFGWKMGVILWIATGLAGSMIWDRCLNIVLDNKAPLQMRASGAFIAMLLGPYWILFFIMGRLYDYANTPQLVSSS